MTKVAIIGAGLVGMVSALALKKIVDVPVKIYDNNPKLQPKSSHPITLRVPHKKLLQQLGIWDVIVSKVVCIKNLSVSQKGYFGQVQLKSTTFNHEALAYTVPYNVLYAALSHSTDSLTNYQSPVHTLAYQNEWDLTYQQDNKCLKTKSQRIIVADGATAPIAQKLGWQATTYGPTFYSLIYTIKTKYWQDNAALQRFTKHCSYGVIPQGSPGKSWLIITMNEKHYQEWSCLETAIQHQQITEDLQSSCGEFEVDALYAAYPSKLHIRQYYTTPGALCLGSSQLSLPPIGAQGFNITLQNIQALINQYQRSAWHIQEPLSWQEEYAKTVESRVQQVFNHAKQWVDIREQQGSVWSNLLQTGAWTWLGINGNIEYDLWQLGQGLNPLEAS